MPIISRPGFFDSASIENLTIETQLLLQAASETYGVAISHSEQSADRTITIPALAGNGDMVITNAVQTLTNKTITNLKLSEILDTNGNELFKFTTTSSAVNEITLANAATSNAPVLSATGGDTNIGITLTPKGSGVVTISGGLVVDGTTTTVNSTTITVDDPIFTLGGDTAPGSDDNKDRGIEFRYHDGSSARIGFFGFDDSTGKFTALTVATNTSEVFSGTAMPAIFGNVEAATISGTTGTFSGVVDITDTTDSSDATGDTGALRTEGGASIAKKLYVGTDADIDGTLEADAITVDGTALNEYIADTVGGMVTSNTESGITVAYQDGDNTLDFTIGTLNQDTTGTATIATTVTITDNESTNENNAIIFTAGGDIDGGNLGLESDGTLTYNPSTGSITATGFIGALTGNASTATEATNITAVANNSADETVYLTFVDGVTGTQGLETDSGLTYNPSTGVLTTTSVTGNLTGDVTGNASGLSATLAVASGGTGATSLTDKAVLISQDTGTDTVGSVALTTSGQLIIGGASGPAAATLTAGSNITITNGDGSITIASASAGTPTAITVADTTDTSSYVALFESATGDLAPKTDAGITYNAGTGVLTATGFAGPLTGNVTGNASGSAATVTEAAQSAITSLGTLTALTVDDVAINGKVVTMTGSTDDTAVFTVGTNGTLSIVTVDTAAAAANIQITADGTVDIDSAGVLTLDSGAAINIEPAAGSAILLDGTISVDAGIITGATSITSTAFVGDITGDVTGTADVATVATTVTITDNESTNENNAVIFTSGGDVDGGNLGLESDGNLTYNPSSGTLTATAFSGALTGNVTGTADVATVATTVTITDNESTDESNAIIFTAGGDVDGGNIGLESDGTLTYNPSTGKVTATGFVGTLTGNVTGNTSGTAATVTGGTQASITATANLVTVGTIGTGVWQGTAVASAYLDADTAHLSGTQTFSGAKTFTSTITVGVDDTGQDVKFFGASAGAYMEWDESADQLRIMGASADATTSTGKLLLATSLTDINANDVIGKIDFQAPHEAGGTDAITVAASIQAIAQGTFSSSVNATDLVFYTGHSEAATEKLRFTSQGEIGVGGANYGTDGQVLTSGGAGAAPAWEDASGGGTIDFVASGAIANGDAVTLNSNGTITACDTATTTTSIGTITAANNFSTAQCNTVVAVWEDNANKVVIAWRDESDSNKGKSVVGTVSGATISYGSVAEFEADDVRVHSACFDSNLNKVVLTYQNADGSTANEGTAIIGTVSGTSISFGTGVVFYDGYCAASYGVFDSNSNKVVIAVRDYGASGDAWGIVGTVSGTSISFGTASSDFEEGTAIYYLNGVFDSNLNKVVFAFSDGNNSSYGTAVVGTVSGTDVTFGSQVVFISARADYMAQAFDPDTNKIVMAFQDQGAGGLKALVGTVSGTSISYGSLATIDSNNSGYSTICYDTNVNRFFVAYSLSGNNFYLRASAGTISGTDTTWTSPTTVDDTTAYYNPVVFDSTNNKIIITTSFYTTPKASCLITDIASATTYATDNYIGVASAAISDTATGSVNVIGSVNESLTSLTVNATYYLQSNGTIATTATDREIGRAIASTKLYLTEARKATGGGWTYIGSTGELDDVADVEFTAMGTAATTKASSIAYALKSGLYDHYAIVFQNVVPASDGQHVKMWLSKTASGTAEYDATTNAYRYGTAQDTYMYVGNSIGSAANEYGITGIVYLHAPHRAEYTFVGMSGLLNQNSSNSVNTVAGSLGGTTYASYLYQDTTAVTGFKIESGSGNIESGEIVLYGLRNA